MTLRRCGQNKFGYDMPIHLMKLLLAYVINAVFIEFKQCKRVTGRKTLQLRYKCCGNSSDSECGQTLECHGAISVLLKMRPRLQSPQVTDSERTIIPLRMDGVD